MSMATEDMAELDDRDREVLEVLADGRANPYLIREETDFDKGETNTVLVRLGRAGYVEQVTRGLYEITNKGREEIGAGEDDVDTDELRDALEDAREAYEEVDGDRVGEALDRMERILEEGDNELDE